RERHDIGCASPLDLIQKPEPLLRERELRWRPQEFQDFALALAQPGAQFGRQGTRGGIALQPLAVGPDLDIAAAQLCKQGRYLHNSTCSLFPLILAGRPELASELRASMAGAAPGCAASASMRTARPESVGAAKSSRSGSP